jgi:hypothetical protein
MSPVRLFGQQATDAGQQRNHRARHLLVGALGRERGQPRPGSGDDVGEGH